MRRVSLFLGITDQPSNRKNHINIISRAGGIAIFVSFLLAVLFAYFINRDNIFSAVQAQYTVFLISIFAFFALGFIEDLLETSPFIRLIIQVALAVFIYSKGIAISFIELPFSIPFFNNTLLEIPDLLSLLITILWIVGITNAFNWIDGLDGLASGVAFISALNIMLLNLVANDIPTAVLASALSGACLGFIPENKFPAKLHMGDSGSYLLGISLAILSLMTFSNMSTDGEFVINEINIVLCFLSVSMPICDMTHVIFSRLKSNLSPFFPDRRHFHHKLLDFGFTSDQTVLIIYMIVLSIYSLINLLMGNYFLCYLNIFIGSFFIYLKYRLIKNN